MTFVRRPWRTSTCFKVLVVWQCLLAVHGSTRIACVRTDMNIRVSVTSLSVSLCLLCCPSLPRCTVTPPPPPPTTVEQSTDFDDSDARLLSCSSSANSTKSCVPPSRLCVDALSSSCLSGAGLTTGWPSPRDVVNQSPSTASLIPDDEGGRPGPASRRT
ncbi:hypothetical protein C8F01DRAFT_633916 [Mycena amicta]|nr:hypothetical protein C8F01DRAFT_633916 [Mycena amicta]